MIATVLASKDFDISIPFVLDSIPGKYAITNRVADPYSVPYRTVFSVHIDPDPALSKPFVSEFKA